ncbi:hypothetical protein [Tahibacter amnicola]|uniref:hypothetical protein n=1 Tax=Tahibacter amnicola TaxID=2976241 RepID=UPI003CCE1D6C
MRGRSSEDGGAVWSTDAAVVFTDCEFLGNSAVRGGALYAGKGEIELDRVAFRGNRAVQEGGAIAAMDAPDFRVDSRLNGHQVQFHDNRAGHRGGG